MGCYGGPHMRRIIHLATGGVCWPASVQAANRKALKYAALPTTHVFQPVAIETLGPIDPSACDFINQIGSQMSVITFSACQWPSKDSILSLSLTLSLQRLRTRPDLP